MRRAAGGPGAARPLLPAAGRARWGARSERRVRLSGGARSHRAALSRRRRRDDRRAEGGGAPRRRRPRHRGEPRALARAHGVGDRWPGAWWRRAYAGGDVAGFFLVMVATDDGAVNGEVAAEARAHGRSSTAPTIRGAATSSCPPCSAGALSRSPYPPAARARSWRGSCARRSRHACPMTAARWPRSLRTRAVCSARAASSVGADGWREAVDADLRGLVAAGRAADAQTRLLERLGG